MQNLGRVLNCVFDKLSMQITIHDASVNTVALVKRY
jgi:hypothetical protein